MIPDGQSLLLRPKVDKAIYDFDIYALKKNGRIYLSFYDMITTLGLAIKYNADQKSASGWFLREDWPFEMDLTKSVVSSRGQLIPVSAGDVYLDDNELVVSGAALGRWFDMVFDYDVAGQYIDIQSEYPLPGIAKLARQNKKIHDVRGLTQTKLPRAEQEEKNFDVTTADVVLRTNARHSEGGKTLRTNQASVSLQGKVLNHEAFVQGLYSLTNSSQEDGLKSITARLSRHEDDPVLLGPLKARSYSIGDINSPSIPLTGNTGQQTGFRVSNNPTDYINFTTTQIRGDALPDWDVELYRDDILIGQQTVGDDGRYSFDNVQLFAADNDFELVFYGPQGEVRNETINVPVSREMLATQNNVYDVAVSIEDQKTYDQQQVDNADSGSLHAAGRYNFLVGDTLGYAGFRTRSVNGDQKYFLSGGATNIWNGYFVDTNAAIDLDGEMGGQLGVRKSFGDKLDLSLNTELRTDGYSPEGTNNPATFTLDGYANMPLPDFIGKNNHASLSYHRSDYVDDTYIRQAAASLSSRLGPVGVSNSLRHEIGDQTGTEIERLMDSLSLRGRWKKFFWRAGMDYNFQPNEGVNKYMVDLNYQPTNKLSGELEIEHQPEDNYTKTRLSGSYQADKYRFSPFLEIDNNHELYAGANLKFGLIDDPERNRPYMTGKSLVNKGIVTGFVYLDKNGNLVFDEGDEPLEGVALESVNVRRRAETNAQGKAIIEDLPSYMATDIHVDEQTLPEADMIVVNKGRSIKPAPGDLYDFKFPVHYAGDLDGTALVLNGDGKEYAKYINVKLLPFDPDAEQAKFSQAAQDGYFVFSLIPPGRYFLVAGNDASETYNAGRPVPQIINIGYDGTIFYGQDLKLQKGVPDVSFNVLDEAVARDMGLAPVADRSRSELEYFVRVEEEKASSLLNVLYRLKVKRVASQYLAGLRKVELPNETGDIINRYWVPGNSVEKAFGLCRQIAANEVPCHVDAALPPQAAPPETTPMPVITQDVGAQGEQPPAMPEKLSSL